MYGLYTKKYPLATLSLLTTVCSINYWRRPAPGIRNNLDIFFSKASGIIYLVYGYNNVSNIVFRVFGYTNGFMIITFYNMSCILYQTKSSHWEYFHMLFHFAGAIGKIIAMS
jgi:hypothetical protein